MPTYNYAITNIITFIYSFLSGVVLLHNVSFIWCCHHWHYFQHITCVMKYQTSMFVCMYVWIYPYVYMFLCLAIFMRVCTYICIYMFEYMWSYWHININIKLCYILRICYNHDNWNVTLNQCCFDVVQRRRWRSSIIKTLFWRHMCMSMLWIINHTVIPITSQIWADIENDTSFLCHYMVILVVVNIYIHGNIIM